MVIREASSGGATTRRERERQRCRDRVLDASAELFGSRGYQQTSMKEIADRADMSVGKLYSCFAGKEEIYRTLFEKYMGEMHRLGDASIRPGDSPLMQLRRRIAAVISHFKEHLDFLRIYSNESPLLFEGAIRREIERNRETAEDLFAKAMAEGELRRVDPAVLSAVLVGAVHELLHMRANRGDVEGFDDAPGIIYRLLIEPLLERSALERKD